MLEGAKPILELLRSAPDQVVEVVVTSNFLDRHTSSERKQVLEASGRVYSCPMERFSPLSDVDSSQGILALVRGLPGISRRSWHDPGCWASTVTGCKTQRT